MCQGTTLLSLVQQHSCSLWWWALKKGFFSTEKYFFKIIATNIYNIYSQNQKMNWSLEY